MIISSHRSNADDRSQFFKPLSTIFFFSCSLILICHRSVNALFHRLLYLLAKYPAYYNFVTLILTASGPVFHHASPFCMRSTNIMLNMTLSIVLSSFEVAQIGLFLWSSYTYNSLVSLEPEWIQKKCGYQRNAATN